MTGAGPAERRDLVDAQRGMFGLEREDRRADLRREALMFLRGRREEAGHAILGEPRCLPIEGACGRTRLLGTFRGGMAEEDDGTNQLIGELLGNCVSRWSCCQSSVGSRRGRARAGIGIPRPDAHSDRERHDMNVMSSPGWG
jgi:hypothetical protein